MDEAYETELSQFMSGLKRTVAEVRAESGRSLDEDKKGMSYEVYKRICEILFESDDDDYLFAHTFLTMEWNLLARSNNSFTLRVQHIEFKNDSLLFFLQNQKAINLVKLPRSLGMSTATQNTHSFAQYLHWQDTSLQIRMF